ncbi:unnamed protein product [Medioppia subpectinata]|uniref:Ribosomal protein S11 n=1 Tax=Medioppia subpectinata TaxID=1979941 RepID=A0A7R9KMW7_9ACAR|nr:unnamed protein product [Medioppia subpectinata]CAG2106193.1 unnamed protein product [Medioppia subpectinata]
MLRSGVHSSGVLQKEGDRRSMMKGLPKTDEGSAGERFHFGGFDKVVDFPSLDTPNTLFDDIPFKELPILHIKSTKNNTIFALCRPDGHFILTRSCGMEGFKNCRKGTNVAAQVTAVGMSARITKMGYKTVRVCINGLGPGRLSSIKGLQTAGINIVSITDTTPICEIPIHRPPAARSV